MEADSEFAASLAALVDAARSHSTGRSLIAQAVDQAKQANFAGDNFGSVTFS